MPQVQVLSPRPPFLWRLAVPEDFSLFFDYYGPNFESQTSNRHGFFQSFMRSALPSAVSRVAGRLRPQLFLLLIFGRTGKSPLNRRFSVFAVKFGEFFQSCLTPCFFVQPYQLFFVILL